MTPDTPQQALPQLPSMPAPAAPQMSAPQKTTQKKSTYATYLGPNASPSISNSGYKSLIGQ